MDEKGFTNYERIFAALGRLIDREKWKHVCVVEFEDGFVVQGRAFVDTTDAYALVTHTRVVARDALNEMVASGGSE
jgi:hypothetical protein